MVRWALLGGVLTAGNHQGETVMMEACSRVCRRGGTSQAQIWSVQLGSWCWSCVGMVQAGLGWGSASLLPVRLPADAGQAATLSCAFDRTCGSLIMTSTASLRTVPSPAPRLLYLQVAARMKQYEDELARKRMMAEHELQRQRMAENVKLQVGAPGWQSLGSCGK